ncbi:hypothetical protein K1719_040577 [Acacia pycnantha]|nr:hypothetical protein K1719_040577 [Acacia pycnantha]
MPPPVGEVLTSSSLMTIIQERRNSSQLFAFGQLQVLTVLTSHIPPPPTFTAPTTAVPASASPATAHVSPTSAKLPSYHLMIGTAVVTLNDKNGSTKNAIAKFIEQNYPHVPSINPDLLTQHLDLRKRSGLLSMVNNSYKLPPSPPSAGRKRGRPPKSKPNDDDMQPPPENANPQVTKSGPGCPPEVMMNLVDPAVPTKRRGRGRPLGSKETPGNLPKPKADLQPQPQPDVPINANPRAKTSGAGHLPEARANSVDQTVPAARRGRTPKAKSAESAFSKETSKNQIPFAPPVPAVPTEALTPNTVPAVPSDTSLPIKSSKGRGRPKKNATVVPHSADAPEDASLPIKSSRGRGRPKKNATVVPHSADAPEDASLPIKSSRGRGRPKKNATVLPHSGDPPEDASLPIKSSRGRGRPKKNATGLPHSGDAPEDVEAGSGGVKRPEDPASRFVGQLEKGTSSVEEELRSKLEYFQSKVNESLAEFKHHFNRAITAIQELEAVAAMDLNAPQQLP